MGLVKSQLMSKLNSYKLMFIKIYKVTQSITASYLLTNK